MFSREFQQNLDVRRSDFTRTHTYLNDLVLGVCSCYRAEKKLTSTNLLSRLTIIRLLETRGHFLKFKITDLSF